MDTLLHETKDLVKKEKHFTYLILSNLKKIEENKLYCDLGYSSLHAYLEKELGYSSAESALRVANIKLMKSSIIAEEKIKKGEINLTQGGTLFQAMTKSDADDKPLKIQEAITKIAGKPTRESEKIIQEIFDIKLKIQEKVILNERLKEKLGRMRKIYGEKSFEEIIEILVDEKIMDSRISSKKEVSSATENKSLTIRDVENPKSRYIAVSVKRAVVVRAQKRCEYAGANGVRCAERRNLEFEHVIPYSRGGGHSLGNLKLYCRGHNQREGILKIDNFLRVAKKKR